MKKVPQGFTLAELLIVVAILGVLTAVSIPLFNGLTEASKEKTDDNYVAVAKTEYIVEYNDSSVTDAGVNVFAATTEFFDLSTHSFYTLRTGIDGYGQGTAAGAVAESHEGMLLACTYEDGAVNAKWVTGALNEDVGDTSPLKTIWQQYNGNWPTMMTNGTLDSGDTTNPNVALVAAYIKSNFPTMNVTYWRVTNESNTYTITITDVDLSTVKSGDSVKVIRFNPKKNPPTYTAAYVKVGYNSAKNYYYIDLKGDLSWSHWRELGQSVYKGPSVSQDDKTKLSYSTTVATYNTYPDTTTWS